MPELDTLSYIQLAGMGATWFAAVLLWFWRARKSTGTDRDMLVLLAVVGGSIFLTLIQFVALMVRLG